MINFDPHSLFAYAQVQTVVSQNSTTIVVTLTTGSGQYFQVGQQICFAPPSTVIPLKTNSMIGRITGIVGDQVTCDITSGNREGSAQFTVAAGWQFANPWTPKVLTDIENILNGITPGATLLSAILNSPTIATPTINIGSDAQGDVLYRSAAGGLARLAPGTAGQILQTNGAGQNPSWATPASISNTTAKARAYMTGNNPVATATFTKVPLNSKGYDPGNNFDATTNYRFTAPVAGKYQVNANLYFASMADGTECIIAIYKNGIVYIEGVYFAKTTGNQSSPSLSDVIDLAQNDYVELFAYQQSGSTVNLLNSGGIYNTMSVHLLSTG